MNLISVKFNFPSAFFPLFKRDQRCMRNVNGIEEQTKLMLVVLFLGSALLRVNNIVIFVICLYHLIRIWIYIFWFCSNFFDWKYFLSIFNFHTLPHHTGDFLCLQTKFLSWEAAALRVGIGDSLSCDIHENDSLICYDRKVKRRLKYLSNVFFLLS